VRLLLDVAQHRHDLLEVTAPQKSHRVSIHEIAAENRFSRAKIRRESASSA
jgi:hypothetical protein